MTEKTTLQPAEITWDVYEITPTTFYAVASAEPHGASRWRM